MYMYICLCISPYPLLEPESLSAPEEPTKREKSASPDSLPPEVLDAAVAQTNAALSDAAGVCSYA